MTLKILLTLFVVFTVGNVVSLIYSKDKILAEADMIATRDMDKLLLETDNLLGSCETSAYNLRGLVTYQDIKSEGLFGVVDKFLKINPHIYGVAIAFEPEVIKAMNISKPATFTTIGKDNKYKHILIDSLYDYKKADWYAHTKELGKENWGNPLHAADGELIAPFCLPLKTENGKFIGVMAIDISLEAISKSLLVAAPYPDAMVTLMDKSFNFVAHPNKDYVLKMSLDSLLKNSTVHPNESIYIDMKKAVRGSSSYGSGKDERIIYYAPVKKAQWTLTIDCPYQDIYAHVDDIKLSMFLNMLFGMLIFGYVCWKLVKRVEQFEKTAAAKAAMQGELNIAAAIQKGMLPKLYPAFPEIKQLDVYGMLEPAKEVGGDLFDYFIRDDKFFFCIGDVSGKGVPASLFMSLIRALFRNITLHESRPAAISQALNTALSEGNDQNMFCTMFIGVLDINTGHLRFCNCGHNAPVVRHITDEGKVDVHYEEINTNIAVGIFDGFPFDDQEVDMKPGEAIFLYTDGVTEAENEHKELYGEDRLLQALANARSHNVRTAKDFIEAVHADVKSFAEVGYQSDDITMVVVEYKGNNPKN